MRLTKVLLPSGNAVELDLDTAKFAYDLGCELTKWNPGVSFRTPIGCEAGAFPMYLRMDELERLASDGSSFDDRLRAYDN